MKKIHSYSKRLLSLALAFLLLMLNILHFDGSKIFVKAENTPEPIIVEDFENRIVVNKHKPSSEYSRFYTDESKITGSSYWMRSSWAVITSDAKPKYSDSSYNRSAYNEYMKMTYVYQAIDLCNIERQSTDKEQYKKADSPKWYKDYEFSPAFVLPNDTKNPDAAFSGETGKEYLISIDVDLIEDDDKKVEIYACPVNYIPGSTKFNNITGYKPSVNSGDILICSTEATGDKSLTLNSGFKTYEFVYKSESGKVPVIMMVTNDAVTVDAPASKTDFACVYIDNIKISNDGNYFTSTLFDGSELNVKYKNGDKLVDINPSVIGYKDDGKWYDDFECKFVTTDIYPVSGKTYYRKWSKYFTLDFESNYQTTTDFYTDPLNQTWFTRSDVSARRERDGNWEMMLTYWNDNPTYRASGNNYGPSGEYFHNYKNNPYFYIYDPAISSCFVGSPNFEYKLSFDYEIAGPIPQYDVSFYLYLTSETDTNDNINCGKLNINVYNGSKGSVKDFEFIAKMGYRPRIVMITNNGERLDSNPNQYHTAYIDNLTVEEIYPEGKELVTVSFDSNGGKAVSGFRIIKGDPIGRLPVSSLSGYLFDYWYDSNDAEQKEINSSYIPSANLNLVAKWASVTASNYDNSELDGFTNIRYPNVLDNYESLDVEKVLDGSIVDSTSTLGNKYIKSGCPNNMNSALLLSNKPAAMSNASRGISAIALLNKDGSKFTVKQGTKYKIEFDYLPLGKPLAHSYIQMVYGSYTADTINMNSAKTIFPTAVHDSALETSTATQYFVAAQDGFVYFTIGTRQNFDSAMIEHFVLLDNIKITVESDVKTISFRDTKGSTLSVEPYGYDTQYGMPGDKVREFGFKYVKNNDIEGFYNDAACTEPCTDYDTFTNSDRTIYVKFKDVDYSTLSDFSTPITLDFESDDEFDLETMYRYVPYMSHTSTDPEIEIDYVGNDPENAYEGNGYIRINDVKYVYSSKGHSFVLYDKNNPSGIMIFEPNTSYRITAKVKYEDDMKVPYLRFWWVDVANNKYTRFNEANLSSTDDDYTGYGEISSVFTVGDTPCAVAIGGVYLAEQDVYVDNVTVEKLNDLTIKFETYGGDKIDDIISLPYKDLSSVDPGSAFKPGYEFIGWYLDEEFTKLFNFSTDYVISDTTLYAKFIKEILEEDEIQNEAEDSKIIYDELLEDDKEDEEDNGPKFGNQLNVLDADDAVKDTVKEITEEPLSIWTVVTVSLGILVLIVTSLTILIIILKKKKRGI